MSLGVNASIVGPYMSGLGVYTIELTKALEKLRQDLIVYTSFPEAFQLTTAKSKNIGFLLNPTHGKWAHLARLMWTQTILPIRLLHDRIAKLLIPIPECVLSCGLPQIVVVHDVIPLKFPQDYSLQNKYFRWYVNPLLRKASAIITVSEQSKTDLLTYLGTKRPQIHVVPGGCNHAAFHPHLDPTEVTRRYDLRRYLLYVGNLHPHKNLSRLIQAFSRFSSRVPHQLVLVGKKDARFYPALLNLVRTMGLNDRVVFLDYVQQHELGSLYAGAEAFVLPSLYEGFGLPLLEAMACGTPVVSGNNGAAAEVVGEAGILVDPSSVQDLAEALESLLTTRKIRQDLQERGFNRVQQFSWERTARQISDIIEHTPE